MIGSLSQKQADRISREALDFWTSAWTNLEEDNRYLRVRDFSRALLALSLSDLETSDSLVGRIVAQATFDRSAPARLAAFDALLIISRETQVPDAMVPALQVGIQDPDALIRAKAAAVTITLLERDVSSHLLLPDLLENPRAFRMAPAHYSNSRLLYSYSLLAPAVLGYQATGEYTEILADALILAALGNLSHAAANSSILRTLQEALIGPIWTIGIVAAEMLERLGEAEKTLNRLMSTLRSSNGVIQPEVIRALSRLYVASRKTPTALMDLLNHPDVTVRANALVALGQTFGATGECAREQFFAFAEDPLLGHLAIDSLREMDRNLQDDQSVVQILREAVSPMNYEDTYDARRSIQSNNRVVKCELAAMCIYVEHVVPERGGAPNTSRDSFDRVIREFVPTLAVYSCSQESSLVRILSTGSPEGALKRAHLLSTRLRDANLSVKIAIHAGVVRLQRDRGDWKLGGIAHTVACAILTECDPGYILVSDNVASGIQRKSKRFGWLESLGIQRISDYGSIGLYTLYDPTTGIGSAGLPRSLRHYARSINRRYTIQAVQRNTNRVVVALILLAILGFGYWIAATFGRYVWAKVAPKTSSLKQTSSSVRAG